MIFQCIHAADDTAQGLSYLDPAISLSMVSYPEEPTEAWAGGLSFIWGKLEYNLNQIDSAALYLTMDEGNDVDLVSEDGLTRLTGTDGRKGTEMEYNTWGYLYADKSYVLTQENLQNGTYYAVPAYGEFGTSAKTGRLFNTSNYAVDGGGHLVFAAKFAPNASAGHYRANVLLSLVAQPKAIAVEFSGFSNITYMQDMNWAVCGAAKIGETKQLIDRRDSKKYWVTKQSDGNCWMTQNLDLDLSSSTALTSVYTDITADWVPANSTQTGSSPNFTTEKNDVQSYDLGVKYCASDGVLARCNLTSSNNGGHDAVGNYYSYNAATAGQATELYEKAAAAGAAGKTEATQSICPKNWRLPTAGINDDFNNRLTDKSFYKLVHGLTPNLLISTAPYYFTLGGYVNKTGIYSPGREGFLWASTAYNGGAYGLFINSSSVIVSGGKFGAEGHPIRCVARPS